MRMLSIRHLELMHMLCACVTEHTTSEELMHTLSIHIRNLKALSSEMDPAEIRLIR